MSNTVRKITKKPITVEAMQYTGGQESATDIMEWVFENGGVANHVCDDPEQCRGGEGTHHITIHTLEGTMRAKSGDWIIRGVNGEFYPCDNDILMKTYTFEDSAPEKDDAKHSLRDRIDLAVGRELFHMNVHLGTVAVLGLDTTNLREAIVDSVLRELGGPEAVEIFELGSKEPVHIVGTCNEHLPVQHRDGKEPWCNACGLNRTMGVPQSLLHRGTDKEPPVSRAWPPSTMETKPLPRDPEVK